MAGGLLAAVAIVIVFLFLVTKTMGWAFFEASANGYIGALYAYIDPRHCRRVATTSPRRP